jgi:Putative beta-barrel porin-2, OmpL-like. bbp2
MRSSQRRCESSNHRRIWPWRRTGCCLVLIWGGATAAFAQQSEPLRAPVQNGEDLRRRVEQLEAEVAELKRLVQAHNTAKLERAEGPSDRHIATNSVEPAMRISSTEGKAQEPRVSGGASLTAEDRKTLDFLRDATINLGVDSYYAYNFNHPVGRVNLLRAYDVLSNNISLNQANFIFERAPDVSQGRRFGGRLDLQFGQATDTLQGNPANEPRPQIYRNVFQAYGTYIAPVRKGLTVDFGKWSSSLGIEGNYTKDQMNYSRSYYYDFLPFYHMGVRATYQVTDHLALTYWLVNGTNQAEATNGFKDELFGFVAKPRKSITWTASYYLGQEHPDRIAVNPIGPIPVQPGLSFQAIRPAPDGRLHIFDSYVTWQLSAKWAMALEGDYVIERLWRNEGPGRSSAPSHVTGGVAYLRYEFTPKVAVAGRAEYLSDRGGLFSGLTQALKETTATFDYKVGDGFLMRYEWRRDFSNQPTFLTDTQGVFSKEQNTATVGLIWWWGRKEGAW